MQDSKAKNCITASGLSHTCYDLYLAQVSSTNQPNRKYNYDDTDNCSILSYNRFLTFFTAFYYLVTIVTQYHQKILNMYKIAVEDTLIYEQIWIVF